VRKSRPERLHPSLPAYVYVFLSDGVPYSLPWWSVSFTCVECCLRHGRRWRCPGMSLGCVSSLRTKRVGTLVSTARVYDTVHEVSMVPWRESALAPHWHPILRAARASLFNLLLVSPCSQSGLHVHHKFKLFVRISCATTVGTSLHFQGAVPYSRARCTDAFGPDSTHTMSV
jgi:hypothetical protein